MRKEAPARVNPVLRHRNEEVISLDGEWFFRLDKEDEGLRRDWHKSPRVFRDTILVPGCWQAQGFGEDSKEEVWDFRLEARVFRATDQSTGWYLKEFEVPAEFKGKLLWLCFGGVHPSADMWLNGKKLGSHSAPFVPFRFEVSSLVRFGSTNRLTVRVYEENRWLGLAYNWQGRWSGLFRGVELHPTGNAWIRQLHLLPQLRQSHIRVRLLTGGRLRSLRLKLVCRDPKGRKVAEATREVESELEEFSFKVPDPMPWSPETPRLYRIDAVLERNSQRLDSLSERTGFLELSAYRKHFLINGEPYFMRGSGDFSCSPETGCPDTDRSRWRKKLSTLRRYGYNYVRCQSYAPTPEYYDVADEVGILVQGEMGALGAWSGTSVWHPYAWPPPLPKYRDLLLWQWEKTVLRDVNHPSASLYCMSNELYRETEFPRTAWECYRRTRLIKPSAMLIWTDGGHNESLPQDFVNDQASIDSQTDLPVIQHEFKWWSSYPDVRLKKKYKGAVRPYALELAEQIASAKGLKKLLPTIARNSQILQYIEARTKMENCRRDNPTLAGICHFNAMDIGFSPQGIINEFYERKFADARTWLQTNGDTVILIDKSFDDRVLLSGETLKSTLFVSDFSHPPLRKPSLKWEATLNRRKISEGVSRYRHIPYRGCRACEIELRTPPLRKPARLELRAGLEEDGRSFFNRWDFWLFPDVDLSRLPLLLYGKPKYTWVGKLKSLPAGKLSLSKLVLSEVLDEALVRFLQEGGKALLAVSEGLVKPFSSKLGLTEGRYFFLPPASYPPYESGHQGTILRRHPLLGDFPHEGFADLNLYRLIAESPPIDLEPLGRLSEEPIIRVFSTYQTCHSLAYLVEFCVGRGRLILSALDLDPKFPEAKFLLSALAKYCLRAKTSCKNELSRKGLLHLLRHTSLP